MMMTRRNFLHALGGSFGAMMLPHMPLSLPERINIPASLMLHSGEGKGDYLPRVLDELNQRGFTAVTYKGWRESVLRNRPIYKPVLISIDDLTLAHGVRYSWDTFWAMKETIQQAGMVATYGVITSPIISEHIWAKQDANRWTLMREWIQDGFELASHTSFHSNFSDKYSRPREDFAQSDYDAEVCDSAELIERELLAQGINYKVETLILPYGSGYSYMQNKPAVHEGILNACAQTNICMVVGIPHGTKPRSRREIVSGHTQIYMGRQGPVVTTDRRRDAVGTVDALDHWWQRNVDRKINPRREHHRV